MAKAGKNKQQSLSISRIEASRFQGPLPPPQVLDHYDKIIPGSAERIISMWENQVRHRQELEMKVIASDIKQSHFGSILGFIIAMSAIGSGTFLAYIGRPTEGIAAIISALVGLVGVYGWGSYQRRKERDTRINQSLE
jgi:uncharacterized membrane protein